MPFMFTPKRGIGFYHSSATSCPHCRAKHDLASDDATGPHRSPTNGDVTLCFTCGWCSVFDYKVASSLRLPTVDEQQQLTADPHIGRIARAWHDIQDAYLG